MRHGYAKDQHHWGFWSQRLRFGHQQEDLYRHSDPRHHRLPWRRGTGWSHRTRTNPHTQQRHQTAHHQHRLCGNHQHCAQHSHSCSATHFLVFRQFTLFTKRQERRWRCSCHRRYNCSYNLCCNSIFPYIAHSLCYFSQTRIHGRCWRRWALRQSTCSCQRSA